MGPLVYNNLYCLTYCVNKHVMYIGSSSAGAIIGILILLLLLVVSLYGFLVFIRFHHNKSCDEQCKVETCNKLKYDFTLRGEQYILVDLTKGGRDEKYFTYFDKFLLNNVNNTNGRIDIESSLLAPEDQKTINSRANLSRAKDKVSYK